MESARVSLHQRIAQMQPFALISRHVRAVGLFIGINETRARQPSAHPLRATHGQGIVDVKLVTWRRWVTIPTSERRTSGDQATIGCGAASTAPCELL